MAYRESVQNRNLKLGLYGDPFFWNIHESVGYGCKNNKSDVHLVQHFLNAYFWTNNQEHRMIKNDGFFGGHTWRAIKNFQKDYAVFTEDEEAGLVSDGCVSKTNGTRFFTPKTHSAYTILLLNISFRRSHLAMYFDDLTRDPEIHEDLKAQLTGMPAVV